MVKKAHKFIICTSIFILNLSVFNGVYAQEFYVGMRTGYGWSNFEYEGSPNYDLSPKSLPSIGITYNYRIKNSKFGINLETGYSDRGIKIDDDELDYGLNYLDLPLLLDYYPTNRLRLNIGPEFDYLISAMNRVNDSTKVNITERFDQRWAVSGVVGMNYSISFFLELGARYHVPFTTISQSDAILNTRKTKSRYFQIYLLFKIAN